MTNIIKVAHLIEYLLRKDIDKVEKATELNAAIDDGIITADEAFELALEYCHTSRWHNAE